MKRFVTSIAAVLCTLSLWAQSDWQQAEDLYRQGKFSAALGAYETVLKNYPNDPFVYYNIGNCYFKIGSRGLAVANYYRAFRLLPRDKDIRHNLALTLEESGEKLVPTGVPTVLHEAFFYLSYAQLKGLTYGLFWLACACVVISLLRRKNSRWTFIACALCVVCAGWWYARSRLERENLAVIAAPVAEIRSGPGTNFPASANVAQGHLITITDAKDAWYEGVVSSQGLKGWIEKDAVEKI